jgi:hypothetical protein
MALWEQLTGLFRRDANHLAAHKLGMDGPPAVAGRHYFRVRLAEMFLRRSRDWFQDRYPAVSSLVRCQFGTAPRFELPNIVDSTEVFKPAGPTAMVIRNLVLAPTLPFRGGTVELTTGLQAMVARNYLSEFVRSLSKFAGLLTLPQVSAAVQVAGPLAEGIQGLFAGGNGDPLLGYAESFDGKTLRGGHVAVVNATAGQLDPAKLSVSNGHLLANGADLTGFDYMLLHVEVFEERDDWDGLQTIIAPLERSIQAVAERKMDDAKEALNQAVAAALLAPELTNADRRRVVDQVKGRYREAASGFESTEEPGPVSLSALMAKAESVEKAAEKPPLTLAEALPR